MFVVRNVFHYALGKLKSVDWRTEEVRDGQEVNSDEISDLEYVLVADGRCVEVVTNPRDPEGRMMLGPVRSTAEYYGDGETK